MTDFLKRPISIGDTVVYLNHSRSSSTFDQGVVVKLGPTMATLANIRGWETKKSYSKLIVVNDQLAANLAAFPEAYL